MGRPLPSFEHWLNFITEDATKAANTHHLHSSDKEEEEKLQAAIQKSRGICYEESCECFAPFRGPRCDIVDEGSEVARARPYKAAVHYIVNDEDDHIAEMAHSLRTLWKRLNAASDYPVLVFHDGLSAASRLYLMNSAPHRMWFHRTPTDFFPSNSSLPAILLANNEEFIRMRHTFHPGYRAQSRFRSGPFFATAVAQRFDYLLGLDGDSMFPGRLEQDPFQVMHSDASLVLGYQYITMTSPSSSQKFWQVSLLYCGLLGADLVKAAEGGHFFQRSLSATGGWETSPSWTNMVVMTDCELVRVSFFKPGTEYYRYFEFLDSFGGFWLHRWGDHAVRALGTGLALWLLEHGSNLDHNESSQVYQAYDMKLSYAHQNSCFCPSDLKCVWHDGREGSGEKHWPKQKKVWTCEPKVATT